jgi:uncharacterized lipoprotein
VLNNNAAYAIVAISVSLFLTACASNEHTRYQNNADLERPPEAPATKKADEAAANEISEPQPRRRGIGLKTDIYKSEDSREFKIRRAYDEAWLLIHQAIQHNELKIADQDRSKGAFYVNYGGHSLLNLTSSLFQGHENEPTYLIKVEGQGNETSATVSLAKKEEQADSNYPKNSAQKEESDRSEDLLDLLFDTLHDHIKAD